MNAARRKEIARASALLSEARTILETASSDEQDYYDNMPENFQSGEKGDRAQEVIDLLNEAVSSIESVESELDNVE